jgi:hypothetical protein
MRLHYAVIFMIIAQTIKQTQEDEIRIMQDTLNSLTN